MRVTRDLPFEFKRLTKNNKENIATFSGLANAYGVVDLAGEEVMPGAFTADLQQNGNRRPLLWQHDTHNVIGYQVLTDTPRGLATEGTLLLNVPQAAIAYELIKNAAIDGISIGYSILKDGYVGGVRQLREVQLFEASIVTFPCNPAALISDVKNLDPATLRRLLTEVKAGRVLSATNRATLQEAHDHATAAGDSVTNSLELIRELLDLTGDPDADDDTEAAAMSLMHDMRRTFASAKAQTTESADAILRRWAYERRLDQLEKAATIRLTGTVQRHVNALNLSITGDNDRSYMLPLSAVPIDGPFSIYSMRNGTRVEFEVGAETDESALRVTGLLDTGAKAEHHPTAAGPISLGERR
jgi:uncharacterized protein